MSYVSAADFRTASLAEYCKGLELTDDDITPTRLTAMIARMSQRFDEWTNDHFESRARIYELSGSGGAVLELPERCTAITYVKTRDYVGTLTTQSSNVYRLVSSLTTSGDMRIGNFDALEVVPGQYLANVWGAWPYGGYFGWPYGPQAVEISGTFGWTVTPADVKRAVALLVADQVKPVAAGIRVASSWSTTDASFTRDPNSASGIKEVDDIIKDYAREGGPRPTVLIG